MKPTSKTLSWAFVIILLAVLPDDMQPMKGASYTIKFEGYS